MTTSEFVDAPPMEEPVDYDDGDDALSLCDLSLDCDAPHYSFADDVPSPSSSSSSSSDQDDLFEFSSFGDSDSSSHLRSDDDRSIVFCGKLIPPRQSPPNHPPPPAPGKKRSPLRAGGGSQKSAGGRTRSPAVRRRKCRWYLMAFGLARFPTEMALSEMRMRQGRNVEKRESCDGSGGEIVRGGDRGDKSKGKGLFGLLKALGLGHRRRADALAKASFGCVPRV